MEPNTEEQIAERLAQLPADVRAAVLSADWEQKVQAIGEKHRLHIDQTGALGDLTLMTMLGMSGLTEYPARIAQELKVPAADAEAMAKEVNDGVFMPIRESMKGFTAERTTAAAPQPTAPTPAPAAPATSIPVPATPAPAAPKPDLSKADALLSATVVSTPVSPAAPQTPAASAQSAPAASEAPKPTAYATDPYREPPV